MASTASSEPHGSRRDWVEHTRRALSDAGHPSTGPRAAVVEVLGRQDCVLTAREIHAELRADGREVGVATVYRALERLDELGLVQRLDTGEGTVRYEPADPSGEHHHHLVCDGCGSVSPFEDEQLERAIRRLARRLDYRVGAHDVVLRGRCPACS